VINKGQMYNDLEFSGDDLFRIEAIEKNPETENEKFLCRMIEKFFFRTAQLQDDLNSLKSTLELA
jgi:hypothetical protein